MNREIKFRAFHIGEEKMCNVELIRPGEGAFLSDLIPETDQINFDTRLIIKAPESGRFCDLSEFHLMQYTEQVDKNGKEIYEGDIITRTDSYSQIWQTVVFGSAKFIAQNRIRPNGNGWLSDNGSSYELGFILNLNKDWEIIGNIYQTPSLLTNPK